MWAFEFEFNKYWELFYFTTLISNLNLKMWAFEYWDLFDFECVGYFIPHYLFEV
jgi:hypothetical protein